jgi:rhodanese-related sulfurtransferase
MLFRQMFDSVSGTYSYLLASRPGGEALIIDPVLEKVDRYVQLLRELDLRLVKAVDTHLHADHVTGLAELRDRTHCITVMGEHTKADVVSMRVDDGDKIKIEGVALDVLYTPGHTDDSYSFTMIMFYCAYGERSAMAAQLAQDAGLTSACHIQGGLSEWKKLGCPVLRGEDPLNLGR